MKHAGQVVTRTMLLENVWDYHFDPQTNVIDVHISRLRSKIDKGFAQPLLHTVRGAGYMIRDECVVTSEVRTPASPKRRGLGLRGAFARLNASAWPRLARSVSFPHHGVQADAGLSHGLRAVRGVPARLFRAGTRAG